MALVDRTLARLAARGGDPEPRAEVAHALALLTAGTRVAEVADAVGYSRRPLAGCTPTTWLREEFPFVQDHGDDEGQAQGHEH